MPSVEVAKLFQEEREKGINIFLADRKTVVYSDLSEEEIKAVKRVFYSGLSQIRKISPRLAEDIEPQLSLAIKIAGVFKEMMPEKKPITFPSEAGSIGVTWIFPQAIRYVATPSATAPAYSSYALNKWDISVTEGTAAYLFGDGTNLYKSSPQVGKRSMLLVFNNGVIEIGSTPRIDQFRLFGEGFAKYGIYTVAPVQEISIEDGRTIYQYPTPLGATPIFYDKGIMWGFMPRASGTITIKLLGLVFYEHDLFPALTWVT